MLQRDSDAAARSFERYPVVALGAGATGLGIGWRSGIPIFEGRETPGGICSSYYVRSDTGERLNRAPEDGKAYRFENGGGHWIFGCHAAAQQHMERCVSLKTYARVSSVFFPEKQLFVPYPIQNHLCFLGTDTAEKVRREMLMEPQGLPRTMAEWQLQRFGRTLTDLFFGPFNRLYTAGLWDRIAPQDAQKSPPCTCSFVKEATGKLHPVGYNAGFAYPVLGLDELFRRMADRCDVRYGKRADSIDIRNQLVHFADGSAVCYEALISTLPLDKTVEMAGLGVDEPPAPHTSVLVVNVGATRGARCPTDHWIYVPESASGFHRVGFYSNVDRSFLPASCRDSGDRVSIYVEKAYASDREPSNDEVDLFSREAVSELRNWGFVGTVEALDATWVDYAYTWSWPSSTWREKALEQLEENRVFMAGRYGRWVFQGIVDSLSEGLSYGTRFGRR